MKPKEKSVKHVDDFLDNLTEEHSKSIEDALKSWDKYTDSKNQNSLLNNIFHPGHDDLYNSLVKALDEEFKGEKGDETKLSKKHHDKAKKAVVKALKSYFEKVQPSVLEAVKEMEDDDAYNHLVKMYDWNIGDGKVKGSKTLSQLMDELLASDKYVGDLKVGFYEIKANNSIAAREFLKSRYIRHHLEPHHHRLHKYIRDELDKKGMRIKKEEIPHFYASETGDLLTMRELYMKKKGHQFLEPKEETEN